MSDAVELARLAMETIAQGADPGNPLHAEIRDNFAAYTKLVERHAAVNAECAAELAKPDAEIDLDRAQALLAEMDAITAEQREVQARQRELVAAAAGTGALQ
jgi:hypothetical protein